jgi:tetratricopeptide (TPR) repeat protein
MLVQAGRGLAAAHAAEIVHRDFKPENVLVGEDGRPRVTDFGLARHERQGGHELDGEMLATAQTVTATVAGTPAYMAPEQLANEPLDARTDQFAFSVVAWECLFGKRPFSGKTLAALALAIDRHELDKPGTVPDRVRRVIERGLETAPAARFADMPALLAALEDAATPRTTRNAIATAIAACAVGAGAFATYNAVTRHQREAACVDERDSTRALFDVSSRIAMQVDFIRTGAATAASSFSHTANALDRYATALADRVDAACRDRDQPERMAKARAACLASRTLELRGLVDAFVHADADLVLRAPDAAWGVFDPSPCVDASPTATGVHTADDAARLGKLKATLRTGHYREGIVEAKSLVDDARARKDKSLELDALLVLAQLEEPLDPNTAIATYHDAQTLAETLGRDLDAALSLASLAIANGLDKHEYVTAHRQIELARAKVERVGGNAALEARLAMAEAQVLAYENRIGEAERAMRTAVAMFEKVFGSDHPMVGNAYGTLSQLEGAFGRHDAAIADAQRTLAILSPALGTDHPSVAGAKMTLASALIYNHDFTRARALLLEADATFALIYGRYHHARSAVASNLGMIEMMQSHWDAAIAAFERSRDIVEHTGNDPDALSSIERDLTNALGGAGRLEEALVECKKGIAALERLGPGGLPRLPQSLNDLGEVQLARGHAADAIADVERGLSLLKERGPDANPDDLADTEFILGKLLWEANRDRVRGHALVEHALKISPEPERRAQMSEWLDAHRR